MSANKKTFSVMNTGYVGESVEEGFRKRVIFKLAEYEDKCRDRQWKPRDIYKRYYFKKHFIIYLASHCYISGRRAHFLISKNIQHYI